MISQEFKFTVDNVNYIHDRVISLYGGGSGIRDTGLLESVIESPYQACFGEDLYPDVIDKAIKYLFDFTNYQIFIDGNKRMGILTAEIFLKMNHLQLYMSLDDKYELVMTIAKGQCTDSKEITTLVRKNIIPIDTALDIEKVSEDTLVGLAEILRKLALGAGADENIQ